MLIFTLLLGYSTKSQCARIELEMFDTKLTQNEPLNVDLNVKFSDLEVEFSKLKRKYCSYEWGYELLVLQTFEKKLSKFRELQKILPLNLEETVEELTKRVIVLEKILGFGNSVESTTQGSQ